MRILKSLSMVCLHNESTSFKSNVDFAICDVKCFFIAQKRVTLVFILDNPPFSLEYKRDAHYNQSNNA